MKRAIDVGKVLQVAGEIKAINLDLTVGQLASSKLVDLVSVADDPWDLICADWITLIRRGPRFDSLFEVRGLAEALRADLRVAGAASQLK